MSRISSNAARDPFLRAFGFTVVMLLALCAVFFALTFFQGPKLSTVQADVAQSTSQQLRLFANQPVAAVRAKQVHVKPAIPFTVQTSGKEIAVHFSAPLAYNTNYSLTVTGVTSPLRDQPSIFDYSFSTADPTVYYLARGADSDSIMSAGIAGGARTAVYTAIHIDEFALVDRVLAVATSDADGVSTLSLVSLSGAGVEKMLLPGDGAVSLLRASDSASTLGFVFTSAGDSADREFTRTLFTINLASGRDLVPALDLAGIPLHVIDWQFVPSTEKLIVDSIDWAVSLIDPTGGSATLPLGEYLTLSHISADGSTLTATDSFGPVALDIAKLTETRIEPSTLGGTVPYGGEVQVLRSGSRLEHVLSYNESTQHFDDYLVRDDGTTSTPILGSTGGPAAVISFSVAPNEQYVAVEIDPNVATSVSDRYIDNPRPTTVTTVIVDIATGAVAASFVGGAFVW